MIKISLLLASFFITFAVYSINKLTDIKEDSINLVYRAEFTNKNRHSLIITVIISSFAVLYLSLFIPFLGFMLFSFLFLLG
jgi:4-hydroxybenzoate polyprenyltransferase